MKEEDFKNSKTGQLIWEEKGFYYRFEPNPLPLDFKLSPVLDNMLLTTALTLGRLDGLTQKFSTQQIHLLRIPFILKEAI